MQDVPKDGATGGGTGLPGDQGNPLVQLVARLPSVKNRFQLTGLVLTVALFVATNRVAPKSLLSQLAAGLIGVLFLVFGQLFESLTKYPPHERAKLTFRLFIVFSILLVVFFLLAIVAAYVDDGRPDPQKSPTPPPGYISIGIAEPTTLAGMVQHLGSVRPDATITFSSTCSDAVRKAQIPRGTYTADSLEQLLTDIRLRVEGTPPLYEVRQSGRIRYEIVCP